MASRPVDDQFIVSSTQTMSEDVSQEHFIHAEHGLVVPQLASCVSVI